MICTQPAETKTEEVCHTKALPVNGETNMGDEDVDSAAFAVSSHRVKNPSDSFYASAIRFGDERF